MSYGAEILTTAGIISVAGLLFVLCWPMTRWAEHGKTHWVVRAGRWLARRWTNDPARRKPRYLFAQGADARATYRRWMDLYYRSGERRKDRRWLKRELRDLKRIAELYPDPEEAQR